MDAISLIKALGGTRQVAGMMAERLGKRVTLPMVSNWRKRGIPILYRPALKAVAEERRIAIPHDFVPGEYPPQSSVDPPLSEPYDSKSKSNARDADNIEGM
jgi:hypothetical protein